jgi:hypothetical protein
MNLHEIELLLQKFFDGETSLEEEKQLKDFFTRGDIPMHLQPMAGYFHFIGREREMELNSSPLGRISSEESKVARLLDFKRPWIYWASGVAASILILIAVFVKFDPFSPRIENTYQDPQTAYLEAKKILYFVSDKLNKGTSRLQPVGTFETGLKSLKPVGAYSQGVGEISRLNEVDRASRMITRN